MVMSGKYETEVELKGSVEKHFRRWRSENHQIPNAAGHHVQGVSVQEGDWDSNGSIKLWNYTCDGKKEVLKERTEIDDNRKIVIFDGLEGDLMEDLKVYHATLQFYPKSEDACICKITMEWEKRNENIPEPVRYWEFAKQLVGDMDI